MLFSERVIVRLCSLEEESMAKDNRTLSRRRFLQMTGLAAAGGLLAACGGGGTEETPMDDEQPADEAPAKDPVVIKHWIFWNQPADCVEAWEQTDELAEALGDNTWEFKTGMGGDTAKTAIAGGTPPDVGVLGSYMDYMSRGVVIPIDDWVAASDVISPDKFISSNWDYAGYEGKQYGVPAYECFVLLGLNYNSRMVEEAGLDPDNPPLTWEGCYEWHEALTKFDDAGNLVQIGLDPYDAMGGAGAPIWFFRYTWDFEYFDPDTDTFDLDNERVAQGFETMGKFVEYVGPDNLAGLRQVEGQGTWGGSYNSEVQAMIIEGYWHIGETMHEKPEVAEVNRVTWAPVPEWREGDKIQSGNYHMAQFFRDAEHQEEAWPIVEWLQSDACCDINFETIGWLPAYLPYLNRVDVSEKPGLEWYINSVEEATHMYDHIKCEIASFIRTKFNEYREAVYRGDLSGAEAAAQFQQAAEEEWDAAGFG